MTEPLHPTKADLRRIIRDRLAGMTPSQKEAGSLAICYRLPQLPLWSAAERILLFAPIGSEPNVWPLLELAQTSAKHVALPAFDVISGSYEARQIRDPDREIILGKYGVREPQPSCPLLPLNRLDLLLVPGVAFDPQGRRLGRGQGYYDRLLAQAGGITCGIAYDEQLVAAVPVTSLDVTLNCILTPTRWIET